VVDGFGEVIVTAALKTGDDILVIRFRGDEDHRNEW
jgi:hypothetical protein